MNKENRKTAKERRAKEREREAKSSALQKDLELPHRL